MGIQGKKQNNEKSGEAVRHQQEKRERAEARQAEYNSLSKEEKLARLAERPGQSKKERARLRRTS